MVAGGYSSILHCVERIVSLRCAASCDDGDLRPCGRLRRKHIYAVTDMAVVDTDTRGQYD